MYGKSAATKNAELLEMSARPNSLGDRKPSTLMMKIRKLSGRSYDAMERAMFLNQLPPEVRTALATSEFASNDEMTDRADRIHEEFKLARRSSASPHLASLELNAVSRLPSRPPLSRRPDNPCYLHRKFGSNAYACRSVNCPMKDRVVAPPSSFQGNGRTGR